MKDATIGGNPHDSGHVMAVQKYEGLTLEPPTKDLVEFGGEEAGDTDAITKEEEWIKKKKTELTTTRQIETRVKRQVVLEDGKVIEDSGPIVSTNTTEDTEKQESETTERRNLGEPDVVDGPNAIEFGDNTREALVRGPVNKDIAPFVLNNGAGKMIRTVVARPDGLVREVKEKKVVSREETDERLETEDIQHFGDFSDETYIKAIKSGAENLQAVLLSPESQQQLVPIGPRIVHQSTKSKKTVDTEDTDLKCLAQPDGTLVTEKKKTTEHEVLIDEDLPESDDKSTGSREKIDHKESSQRFHKQRDEQKVDYVANGKIIGTEMRYAAETEQMERDGPTEDPADWDSLSDRVRKARRAQKTLLQQQREALLGDRREALTNRPLDFEKEEETRKLETSRWLESHFGSESRSSRDSQDNEQVVVEPTKKTYFNVTIKSNANQSPSPRELTPVRQVASPNHLNNGYASKLSAPPKVYVPERERDAAIVTQPTTKFFQGISDWSERKESSPKNFPPKSFQEELKNTLEKKHLIKQTSLPLSRAEHHSKTKEENNYQRSAAIVNGGGYRNGIRRHSRDDSDDSRIVRGPREDPGYISGSRTDLRYRSNSREELDRYPVNSKKDWSHLRREDSGYVKDSREDLRYGRNGREDSFIRDQIETDRSFKEIRQPSIQRDDSAYVSSSTYLTAPRSPKAVRSPSARTPDSGVRSPTPDDDLEEGGRPIAPQRKRAMERRMRKNENGYPPLQQEPHPDYSPPRSRSESPAINQQRPLLQPNGSTTSKKQYQKTRFENETRSSSVPQQSSSTVTSSAQQQQKEKPNKVGSAIGNSIRKLVGKIRSASAERKLKMKSNKQRSPSPQKSKSKQQQQNAQNNNNNNIPSNGSTYQQYNIIDGHIGQQQQQTQSQTQTQQSNQHDSRETSICSSSGRREKTFERRGSSDLDMMISSPKQRYYLGEDPYGGSIYGKENKYDAIRKRERERERERERDRVNRRLKTEEPEVYVSSRANLTNGHTTNSSTLGRFSKSTNRLTTTNNNDHDGYRNVQTLPRKLEHKPLHSSTINVSIVNSVQHPAQNTGPAKPARTYKSLNRSKSFNVHGLNGTNDPSPIYMSKLTRNYSNNFYKSNPHVNETVPQLKSPSIVNLVSRSQRDLTKLDEERKYNGYLTEKRYQTNGINHNNNITNGNNYTNGHLYDKRQVFLKGLQDQAPELYKTLHGGDDVDHHGRSNGYSPFKYSLDKNGNRERESSLGSRSPITINKDTASIIRRGSSSTDDYSETYKYSTKSGDPYRPSVTDTVQSFSKKTLPSRNGAKETIESSEIKTVTTSRYRGEPMSNIRYKETERGRRDDGGPVVIEVRHNSRRN